MEYRLDIVGYDMALEFEGEDDDTAIAVALSAKSPFGHALSRHGRFLAWFEPGHGEIISIIDQLHS